MARWESSTRGWFFTSLNLLSILCLNFVSALRTAHEIPRARFVEAVARRLFPQGIYWSQIKCQGNIPYQFLDFPLSVLQGRSPEEAYPDVLSLCAASNVGGTNIGGNPWWNADAYCAWRLDPPTVIISHFQDVRPTTARHLIFWSNTVTFCQSRCFCLQDVNSPIVPNAAIPAPEVVESQSNPNGRIIRNPPRADLGPPLAEGDIKPIKTYIFWSQAHNFPHNHVPVELRILLLSPGVDIDDIKCVGPMPPFALPPPFTDYQFPSLQSLCASIHFGGDSAGNLGGMCLRSLGYLVFSALYVHPGFSRFGDMNAFATQCWCITHCGCGNEEPVKEFEMMGANGLRRIYEPEFTNGGLIMRYKDSDGNSHGWRLLPSNEGGPSSSSNQQQQCNLEAGSTCSSGYYLTSAELSSLENFRKGPSLPLRIIGGSGKVRVSPFDQTSVQSYEDSTPKICGGICSNFMDCASSLSEDCRCVVDVSHEDAQANGLAAVFTQSLCLPLAMASMALSRKWSGLGGRSVDSDFLCACNGTFASRGCCDSLEGLVD